MPDDFVMQKNPLFLKLLSTKIPRRAARREKEEISRRNLKWERRVRIRERLLMQAQHEEENAQFAPATWSK